MSIKNQKRNKKKQKTMKSLVPRTDLIAVDPRIKKEGVETETAEIVTTEGVVHGHVTEVEIVTGEEIVGIVEDNVQCPESADVQYHVRGLADQILEGVDLHHVTEGGDHPHETEDEDLYLEIDQGDLHPERDPGGPHQEIDLEGQHQEIEVADPCQEREVKDQPLVKKAEDQLLETEPTGHLHEREALEIGAVVPLLEAEIDGQHLVIVGQHQEGVLLPGNIDDHTGVAETGHQMKREKVADHNSAATVTGSVMMTLIVERLAEIEPLHLVVNLRQVMDYRSVWILFLCQAPYQCLQWRLLLHLHHPTFPLHCKPWTCQKKASHQKSHQLPHQ
jgi:hypothetical protein